GLPRPERRSGNRLREMQEVGDMLSVEFAAIEETLLETSRGIVGAGVVGDGDAYHLGLGQRLLRLQSVSFLRSLQLGDALAQCLAEVGILLLQEVVRIS